MLLPREKPFRICPKPCYPWDPGPLGQGSRGYAFSTHQAWANPIACCREARYRFSRRQPHPAGHRQARALPQVFSNGQLQSIYASTLNRTQLTAQPLSESLAEPVHVIDGLEEISAGELEMLADEASRSAYVMCLRSWMHGDWEQKMPGGPNGHDFIERFSQALESIAQAQDYSGTAAVFSHGAAIRVFSAWATKMAPGKASQLVIENTGGSLLELGIGGQWSLVRWDTEPLGGDFVRDVLDKDVTGGEDDAA
ncbi:histidine phosphatase family protein [Glutamicibacter sp. HZAU]|uniref:histidine phosphatase family protein n=1 Tax=Glutamicibacter sp. HZAU TaxID=2049891 RepID=UPI000FFBC2E4|nr:histidine phosphatase family protein [Glutamicibacter sp. HZAU]RWZ82180.1 histidine phosphatase family protein [Glutamicibacter sp. HZAU]